MRGDGGFGRFIHLDDLEDAGYGDYRILFTSDTDGPDRGEPMPETISTPVEIVALLVSPAHAFEGRPTDGPRPDPVPVEHDEVTVRAGLGLVGDRYFNRPAHPCAWMDVVLAPGAFRALRGRGGVRCTPLDDGILRVGPATLTVMRLGHGGRAARSA